ncbi:hypothetical protein D3C78_20870 [compost metagenome]
MSKSAYMTNQIIGEQLLIARLDADEGICYFHNVVNEAKLTVRSEQSFQLGDQVMTLIDVMDDYIIVAVEDQIVIEENEYILNQAILGIDDLVITRLDAQRSTCYCHHIASGAKVSFRTGQRVQVGSNILKLVAVNFGAVIFEIAQ